MMSCHRLLVALFVALFVTGCASSPTTQQFSPPKNIPPSLDTPFLPRATIEWHTIDDLAGAVDTGKPIMLYFYASWCGWCKKLNKSVFEDAKVAQLLNDSYFPIKIDVEKEKRLAAVAGVEALPTVMLLQPIVSKSDGTTNMADPTYSDKSEVVVGCQPALLKAKLREFKEANK